MSSARQEQFIKRHEALWDRFEASLHYRSASARERKKLEPAEAVDLPNDYRQICQHYALANSRMYSPLLVERLNHMVIQGHQTLYGSQSHFFKSLLAFFAHEFPALVRQEWRVMSVSSAPVLCTIHWYDSFDAVYA